MTRFTRVSVSVLILAGLTAATILVALTRTSAQARCRADSECGGAVCVLGKCVPQCASKRRDGDETDVDCGGACEPCRDGQRCKSGEDCRSGACEASRCGRNFCSDGVIGDGETDVDCGGTCAAEKLCALHAKCHEDTDCSSNACRNEVCVPQRAVLGAHLVDDMEDANTTVILGEGRSGVWHILSDGTGQGIIRPERLEGHVKSGSYAMHASGSGFTNWGAGLGLDLNNPGQHADTKAPYDASEFTGIEFWARSARPMSIAIALPDANTDPSGGRCSACGHHWHTTVAVESEWKRFAIEFGKLVLDPGTEPAPAAPDLRTLTSIQFRVNANIEYDFWIDDLAFLR